MEAEPSRHNKLKSILQDRSLEPQSLPQEDLRMITNNFSDERLLGEGGFGKVYKGVLQHGDMIAVKKLTLTMPGIQDRHFENEVHHLMRLKHPNIVQLVGYCSETENVIAQYNGKYVCAEKSERLLCLEYLPKGSLHGHLSDQSSGLDWDTRYKVIEGICYGLHYLHEEWEVTPIIHMDLKPTNILLDDNMVPKIADFGLSRLFSEEQTRACTRSRDGTLGYMAPEYINRGIITKKLDIFSLGVIIIEIMTGHKDYPDETETSAQEFVELVLKNWRNRLEKAPGYTSRELDCQQVRRCIQIGLDCVKLDRAKRPTIRQIIKLLHGLRGAECSNEREVLQIKKESKAWEEIVRHEQDCCLEGKDELKSYRYTEQNMVLFFNCVHHLVGATFGGCYTASDEFDAAQKVLVDKLKACAYDQLGALRPDHIMTETDKFPVPLHMDTDAGSGAGSSNPNCSGRLAAHQVAGIPVGEGLSHAKIESSCIIVNNDPGPSSAIPDPHRTHKYQAGTGRMSASDSDSAADIHRREKRRLSSRAARLRKQQHLDELLQGVARLKSENARVRSRTAGIMAEYARVEQDNLVLRAHAVELSSRLRSLKEVLGVVGEFSGVAMGIQEELLQPWQLPCPAAAMPTGATWLL